MGALRTIGRGLLDTVGGVVAGAVVLAGVSLFQRVASKVRGHR